ncbi:MAG: hypothetical protein J6S98_09065 [Lentisphaeria bacterium]|nr:hypothetical protein [Lentisphaeria bacterium]MBO5802223.1 hypothetical protein [Lentisphaeria bacterium]
MAMSIDEKKTDNPVLPPEQQNPLSGGIELLTKVLKSVFVILAVVIIALLIWFLTCGGSFIVDSTTESVIVLKFGKFHGEYKEGWHWFPPYPITKIIRIPTRKETVVSTAFLPSNAAKIRDSKAKTLMGNDAGSTLTPGVDGYALLKDNTIIHSEWSLTYRIASPEDFYKNCISREANAFSDAASEDFVSDGELKMVKLDAVSAMLRALLDAAVIEAGRTLDIEQTYYDPNNYLQTVRNILNRKIAALGIGIEMDNLTMTLISPPLKTRDAFQEFLLAKTTAQREVEEAKTFKAELEQKTSAETEKIVADGRLKKQQIIEETEADAKSFKEILEKYKDAPDATIISFTKQLAESLEQVREKYVISTDDASGSEVRLKINREPAKKKATPDDGKEAVK